MGYGAFGSPAFRWYDETLAAGITATGQVAIRYITKCINDYLANQIGFVKDRVASSDTDSTYFVVQDLVDKRWPELTDKQQIVDKLDEFMQNEMEPFIDESFEKLSKYLNCDVNLLDMKREAIADVFIIRAKKNYIMQVYDMEGVRYADPYMKMMGIETAKTSTPMFVRKALKHALGLVVNGNEQELRDYVSKFKKDFYTTDIINIGRPSSLNNVTDYCTKDWHPVKTRTVPMHVLGAINYNRLIVENKLTHKYELMKNASKMRYINLKEPNPIKSHVIGFIEDIPAEFGLEEYIDKDLQFEKLFLKPLLTFTIYNNWRLKENSLAKLFDKPLDVQRTIKVEKTTVKKRTKSFFK